MRRMTAKGITAAGLACGVVLAACGGESKPAASAGNCPDGTVLRGSDCAPEGSDDPAHAPAKKGSSDEAVEAAPAAGSSTYDRDAVDAELKRAGRQVKSNCGSATDESGEANGPWGRLTVSVVLGRNGHVKGASVPPPYDGKPVGDCIAHAFEKIQFPPYAGSEDKTVQWDVILVAPKR
jgi:hypothetical protein